MFLQLEKKYSWQFSSFPTLLVAPLSYNIEFSLQAKAMASGVSVDVTGFSVSFNEYLRLISIKRRAEPDEDSLTEVFRLFDPHNTGQLEEGQFRKILSSKQGITDEDIEEMIAGKIHHFNIVSLH